MDNKKLQITLGNLFRMYDDLRTRIDEERDENFNQFSSYSANPDGWEYPINEMLTDVITERIRLATKLESINDLLSDLRSEVWVEIKIADELESKKKLQAEQDKIELYND